MIPPGCVFKALLSTVWRVAWGEEQKGKECSRKKEQLQTVKLKAGAGVFQDLPGAGGQEQRGGEKE